MMTTTAWDTHLAPLLDEPALAPFALNGALVLWSADGASILHADAAGRALLAEPLAQDGLDRLRALAAAIAPSAGVRLERVALIDGQAALTTACRIVTTPEGDKALLTLFRPARARAVAAPTASAEVAASVPQEPPPVAVPTPDAPSLPREGNLRFLWDIDADGVITRLSPEFAQAFGEARRTALTGRRLSELIGTEIADPDGRLMAALATRQTWSGLTVRWRHNETEAVRVDLSALPMQDATRRTLGFRGFGMARLGQRDLWQGEAPAADAPVAVSAPLETPPPATTEDEVILAPIGPETPRETVVQLHPRAQPPVAIAPPPALSPVEKQAFREIAKALGARLEGDEPDITTAPQQAAERAPGPEITGPGVPADAPVDVADASGEQDGTAAEAHDDAPDRDAPAAEPVSDAAAANNRPAAPMIGARALQHSLPFSFGGTGTGDVVFAELLDKLPIGVLVSRAGKVIYANRTLIDLLDYDRLSDLAAPGFLARLFRGPVPTDDSPTLVLEGRGGEPVPVDARLSSIIWNGEAATLFAFRRAMRADASGRAQALELETDALKARLDEQVAILDTATDGVITVDSRGRILSLNRSAEALFGYDQREVTGEPITALLAPESHGAALDYLEGLIGGGVASVMNDGREVMARERQGGRIPLFMTMGAIREGEDRKFCAVLRDMTAWKKAEGDLTAARQAAEEASRQKSDLLAKISHEIRTPLNAIIGFSEMMTAESFGPLGSPKYKEYLHDIRESGAYVMSLVNDLLDLAKVEAGRLDLEFGSVSLAEVAQASVGLLQPEAARARVLIRSSFTPKMPPVVADARSLRQIIINLLSNAVKFTDPGGQIIISTALGDKGEAILRIRDTGIGMDQDELKLAMEPFRQVASTTRKAKGTGLGLPLTKALVEANRGELLIASAKGEGTLVEVVFPPQRVLAG
jgi:PAS domain S-box-containing protein